MRTYCPWLNPLGLCLAIALTACGGRSSDTAEIVSPAGQAPVSAAPFLAGSGSAALAQAASSGVFPPPSSLPRSASGPPDNYDRKSSGSGWGQSLPHANVAMDTFQPSQPPEPPQQLAHAAYATYYFSNMAGYDGLKRIKLDWDTPPAPKETYIGLANFAADRWDWFQPDGNFELPVPDFTPYTEPGEHMYVCVLVLGSSVAQLEYVVAGESFIHHVSFNSDLNSDPLLNIAPLAVQFSALTSDSAGATIVSWDWDWESDGTYDLTNDTNGEEVHVFAPGTWTTTVRVTDDEGATGTGSLTFVAINSDNQPPTAVFDTSETTGDAPLVSYFNAQTSFDPDGTIIKFEWDFDGDNTYEADNGSVLDALHTFGRKGLTLVRLRVTDNDLATDTASVAIILDSGWRDTVIDNDTTLNDTISTAVFGSATKLPCVVYSDWINHELRFASAQSGDGSTWNPPVTPVSSSFWSGKSPTVISLVSGIPLIAYSDYELPAAVYSLHVVSATDDTASAWELPLLVSAGDDAGADSSMILLNTIPVIAAQVGTSQLNSHVNFYYADNAAGTSWNAGQLALPMYDSCIYGAISLLSCGSGVFKHAAIAFRRSNSQSVHESGFTSAADLEGTAWNAPLTFPVFPLQTTAGLQVDGQPALLMGFPNMHGKLYYTRATDADGTAFGALQQIGSGGDGNLVIYNGKPAACFYDVDLRQLALVTAVDAQGSDWNAPYSVDTVEQVGSRCSMVVNNGAPVICYYDDANKRLKAAYWE